MQKCLSGCMFLFLSSIYQYLSLLSIYPAVPRSGTAGSHGNSVFHLSKALLV